MGLLLKKFAFGCREHFLDNRRRHIHDPSHAFTSHFTIEKKKKIRFCSPAKLGKAYVLKVLRLPVSETACLCSEGGHMGTQCKGLNMDWAVQRAWSWLSICVAASTMPTSSHWAPSSHLPQGDGAASVNMHVCFKSHFARHTILSRAQGSQELFQNQGELS